MRIHFIGIGGVGVSALGEVALARGDRVTGSDRSASPITARLAAHGAGVTIGHCADAVRAAAPDLVVYSAAISDA
ncbi:MAG: UDP-N-acetylmuramate--L-alanine ligase, partial [Armatimonadetes bacterium]|nr:UDP-N-acetylmuramate--L-alanine ligase [Armatimonadota bacterium]